MALIERKIIDNIQVQGEFKALNIREDNQILDDQTGEIRSSANWHRRVLEPDADVSGEPAEIQAIAAAMWTDEVKTAWAAHLESVKP
jgi:hypothetical protein